MRRILLILSLLLSLGLPLPGWAAIAFLETQTTSLGSAGVSITVTITVAAGNFAVCSLWTNTNGDQVLTFTDNASPTPNTWTRSSAGEIFTANKWGYQYYVYNADDFTTVTATFTSQFAQMTCSEFSGISTTDPLDQHTRTSGQETTTPTSGNVTTTQADELLYGTLTGSVDESVTAGSGFTLTTGTTRLNVEYQIVSSTGTYAATFAGATSEATSVDISTFKGAGGAPPAAETFGFYKRRVQ